MEDRRAIVETIARRITGVDQDVGIELEYLPSLLKRGNVGNEPVSA
jgi:hypothetical protein